MYISLIIVSVIFLTIALRQIIPQIKLKIWQIMCLGAIATLAFKEISLKKAFEAIEWNIIGFLAGMFILGKAIEESHLLTYFLEKKFLKLPQGLFLFLFIFSTGILSAFFLNDTIAIIGTPAAIYLARRRGLNEQKLLIGLCFAITIGSVFSPIGNPQNLLIALNGNLKTPFLIFIKYLAIPSLINLLIVFFMFRKSLKMQKKVKLAQITPISTKYFSWVVSISIISLVLMVAFNIFFSSWQIPLLYLAIIPAGIILIFGNKRKRLIQTLDIQTLLFFIALFIVMASVWNHFNEKEFLKNLNYTEGNILILGTLISQLISNVPLVALLLPLIPKSPSLLMALAAGSTIAGNLLLLGAASNIIVAEISEKRLNKTFSYFTFAKYGVPLTIINFIVYYIYFSILKLNR